jgi:hypothetical protein
MHYLPTYLNCGKGSTKSGLKNPKVTITNLVTLASNNFGKNALSIVTIASAYRTEDPGFEYLHGVSFLQHCSAVVKTLSLCVFETSK